MPQRDQNTERISPRLQEEILTLVSHNDKLALFLRGAVSLDLYDEAYKPIATLLYDFVDQYKKPPKDSLDTVLESVGTDEASRTFVSRFVRGTVATKDTISTEFVRDRVDAFVLHREIYKGVHAAAVCIGEGDTHGARLAMQKALTTHSEAADPGIIAGDLSRALAYLDEPETAFPTGIPEFDKRKLGPKRKTLHVFVGAAKAGKTWWLCHLGRLAAEHRFKVLHVTLEMSEAQIAKRYHHAFLAATTTDEPLPLHSRLDMAPSGRFFVRQAPTNANTYLRDRGALTDKLPKLPGLENIYIKEFPTGTMTMPELESHLELLENSYDFQPDLLLVDYADLMYLGTDNYRLELGKVYKDLRGLAVSRNLAVATASQSNREGVKSRNITEANLAEDFSKAATADTMITLNKTEAERSLGLARLYVALARSDSDKFSVSISQSYPTGQFVLDSCLTHELDIEHPAVGTGEQVEEPKSEPIF